QEDRRDFRTRCARVQAQARVFEDASQSFAIRDAGSTGAVEVLVAIAAHGSPRLSRKTEIGPAGETACPTQFANLWTARKVGQTVSSAVPPGTYGQSVPFAAYNYSGHGRKPASGSRRTPFPALTLGAISPVDAHRQINNLSA